VGAGRGRWIEAIRPTVERYETIFGSRRRPEGVAVLADSFSGEIREHGRPTPTHLAIFGAFGRLVRAQGAKTQLRLYHEVSVATPDEQWFEYVDCHERTGLLGALRAVR
jgi:hypothetical protein